MSQVTRIYHNAELRASQALPSPPRYKTVQNCSCPPAIDSGKYRNHELPPTSPRSPSVPPSERSYANPTPPMKEHNVDEYLEYQHQASAGPLLPPAPHHYAPQSSYNHHQPYATTSPPYLANPNKRHPFSSARPYSSYHDGDGKPQKRRRNLQSETTDKLRAWFMANMVNLYPTSDQMQDLMRATGLPMGKFPCLPFYLDIQKLIRHGRPDFQVVHQCQTTAPAYNDQ